MEWDTNKGSSELLLERVVSWGAQLASDIGSMVDGRGKCRKVSSCVFLELLKYIPNVFVLDKYFTTYNAALRCLGDGEL
jgi:hypothetical protein